MLYAISVTNFVTALIGLAGNYSSCLLKLIVSWSLCITQESSTKNMIFMCIGTWKNHQGCSILYYYRLSLTIFPVSNKEIERKTVNSCENQVIWDRQIMEWEM